MPWMCRHRHNPVVTAHRWLKISDPNRQLPQFGTDEQTQALISADATLDTVADRLAAMGAAVRRMRYLIEDEEISSAGWAESRECPLTRPRAPVRIRRTGAAFRAAREHFDMAWQRPTAAGEQQPTSTSVHELLPAGWVDYFPYPTFNPAQTQALPEVLGDDDNLVIVAPTGAGKTVIGMAAALKAILQHRRKAAWLVPQRSLTDELDRDLDLWRRRGLRVERLSGEHRLDAAQLGDADLWVATTEKFESLCRTASLSEVLAQVGVLIVDEVHMLGDPARGSILEGLLARMRDTPDTVRLVGLSATVTNSAEIAAWLDARLVDVAWRPGRLTWQLPVIAAHQDWNVTEATRTRLAAAITATVTRDGGSVLVFCGSKRSVRLTALVVAATRGADVRQVHVDDVEKVHAVCHLAGVGLHYSGWAYRTEAEEAFRSRRYEVLVATSTVAAGVNLPARAVVVRDTQIGLSSADVSTVLQMFGRAGRAGAGENDGWAFLIVDEHEHESWRERLTDGYTVTSQIQANLPEQLLSEAVQQRVGSGTEADQWWVRTLAHHQGRRVTSPMEPATRFLKDAGMLTDVPEATGKITATDLGRLTARLMIPPTVGDDLRRALAELPLPAGPDEAEAMLIRTLSTVVPKLARATASDAIKPELARLLTAMPASTLSGIREKDMTPVPGGAPGDLAQVSLLISAGLVTSPDTDSPGRAVPYAAMYPIVEEAPRYLHWLGSQGFFGTVHPWCAIIAGDLSRRLRWRRCGPRRGAGRLLWMVEQMADRSRLEVDVPAMWLAATERGVTAPDWAVGKPPAGCALADQDYLALLRERATDCSISEYPPHAWVTGAPGSVVVTWDGPRWRVTPLRRGSSVEAPYPEGGHAERGAAVFTRRGDHRATGWMSAYATTTHAPDDGGSRSANPSQAKVLSTTQPPSVSSGLEAGRRTSRNQPRA
jgi:helicase